MTALALTPCTNIAKIHKPHNHKDLNLLSSAAAFMTDFDVRRPLVLDNDTLAVDAETLMKKSHVKLKLVVDKSGQFMGTLSLSDLHEQEVVKHVAEGYKRDELSVAEFMTPREHILAATLDDLEVVSIGYLLKSLALNQQQHLLVVDDIEDELRGIISASDIARKLMLDVDLTKAVTFSHIYKTLQH